MGLKILYKYFTKKTTPTTNKRKSGLRKSAESELQTQENKIISKHRKSIDKITNEYTAIHLNGVDKSQIQNLLHYWYTLSKGGLMVPEEFGGFLQDAFPQATEDGGVLSFLFRAMDPDLSGEIDPREFLELTLGLARKFTKEKNNKIWFDFYDSDGNGVISQQDVEDCVSFFKEASGMTDEAAEQFRGIFKLYYVDDKNIVTFDKFQDMLEDGMNVYGGMIFDGVFEQLSKDKTQKRKSNPF